MNRTPDKRRMERAAERHPGRLRLRFVRRRLRPRRRRPKCPRVRCVEVGVDHDFRRRSRVPLVAPQSTHCSRPSLRTDPADLGLPVFAGRSSRNLDSFEVARPNQVSSVHSRPAR